MSNKVESDSINRGQLATRKRFIPNVPVTNHLGESFDFYEDLIKDKIVLLHLTSIHHDSRYQVANNITRIQSAVSQNVTTAEFGKDIFIYSISVAPETDTVERLRIFARRCRAGKGWQFLTGPVQSIEAIHSTLFAHSMNRDLPDRTEVLASHNDRQDCSMGLLRYGNDRLGLWGSVPGKAKPDMVARRINWLIPKKNKSSSAKLERRGPFPNRQFHI